jgi:hypothetical protein
MTDKKIILPEGIPESEREEYEELVKTADRARKDPNAYKKERMTAEDDLSNFVPEK